MERLFMKRNDLGLGARRGDYRSEAAADSMMKLKQTGSEWIALSFWTWQDSIFSTNIYFDYGYTVTDRDIEFAVKKAHSSGIKVCLKPVVNCRDGIWRGRIGFPKEDEAAPYWDQWFLSYTGFILHYAELAEELGCEMLCIGCEMIGTEAMTDQWRRLIALIRNVYKGPIIYNANHGNEGIKRYVTTATKKPELTLTG